MVFLLVARSVVLIFSVLLAITVLSLSCAVIYMHSKVWLFGIVRYDPATALSVAISILHISTVTPLIVMDFLGRKTIFTTVLFEAIWLWVLWQLWLTTAAFATASDPSGYNGDMSCGWYISSRCYAHRFIEIFSFVNWIQLMIYTNTLSTLAVIGHLRRQRMWLSSVRDAPILSSPLALTMPTEFQSKPGFFSNSTISMSYSQPPIPPFPSSPIPPQPPAMPAMVHSPPPHGESSSEASPMLYHIPGTPRAPLTPRSPFPNGGPIPTTPGAPDGQTPPRSHEASLSSMEMERTQRPPPSYSDQASGTGPPAVTPQTALPA
ncbi:hypothetical protein DENSPDRAFT_830812 [Dentipellis sp. KUC8613]|nr:hypothetical protein DENSPDRAFT_830812 [Dentipellis sp. KUC8613]